MFNYEYFSDQLNLLSVSETMPKKKKGGHGGSRHGAGRPPKGNKGCIWCSNVSVAGRLLGFAALLYVFDLLQLYQYYEIL